MLSVLRPISKQRVRDRQEGQGRWGYSGLLPLPRNALSRTGALARQWASQRSGTRAQPGSVHFDPQAVLPFGIMINDLITAFLVAFAAVTASDLLSRIWEYF